jgi:ribose 5-phosphate isomerase B
VKSFSISVGADHAGFFLKGTVIDFLRAEGHEVEDCGSYGPEPVDFPDLVRTVCGRIIAGKAQRAVLVCGSGVGACIAANKMRGIRASVCHDIYSAHQCVEHDNVNTVCIGAQIIGEKVAEECLRAFLAAEFSTGEEFRRRVAKLTEMEQSGA